MMAMLTKILQGKKVLTRSEAILLLGVNRRTMFRWEKAAKIVPVIEVRKKRFYSRKDVLKIARQRNKD